VREKLKAAGGELPSRGVVARTSEDAVPKVIACAKLAGIAMMVGLPHEPLMVIVVPGEKAQVPVLESGA